MKKKRSSDSGRLISDSIKNICDTQSKQVLFSESMLENVKKHLEKKQDKIITYDKLIREKISEAYDLLALWGESLLKDPHILFFLNSLDKKIAASGKAMDACGISSACMCCDQEDGETCCGAGIENKFTSRLLLINLLFGNALPENRRNSNSCFFLAEKGCSLKLRLVLCVNCLCHKIQRMLAVEELTSLQQITGEEMDESFILDEAVKKFIDSKRVRQVTLDVTKK